MSGWQLGLLVFGCLAAGWVGGIVTVWAYARHVFRQQAARLTAEAEGLTITGSASGGDLRISGHVEPPPNRSTYDGPGELL